MSNPILISFLSSFLSFYILEPELSKIVISCFRREFPVRLENPHVISSNQVWVGVVPSGPSGYSFNSSYKSRDSLEYKLDLGNAIGMFRNLKGKVKLLHLYLYIVFIDSKELLFCIVCTAVNFSRIVPDGLLVFFPSYYLMDQCIDCWKHMVRQ